MNASSSHAVPIIGAQPGKPESDAVPMWIIIVLALAGYLGMVYFDEYGGWFDPEVYAPFRSYVQVQEYQPRVEEGGFNKANGKKVFEQICALCHNTDGTGRSGVGPPFVGSEWVNGSANRMIRIPLLGLAGPVNVKGLPQTWPASMPSQASLSDQDLADAISHIRTSWGNKGTIVKPEEVKAVRAELGNSSQATSEPELLKLQ